MKLCAALLAGFITLSSVAAEKENARPLPMNTRVDTIDAAGKTFTHKNKDGKEVKFVVTAQTRIRNKEASARFEDIKVGDTVAGSRIKKSDTEWEVKSITKFGPAPAKAEKN